MHKTLLLCFIHGFKGGDDTFGKFPEDLQALVGHALPNITIKVVTYPKYDTRGDLTECVGRFREWLQNKVIDLEVAASTPSPTVDPSVHTVLLGHSMGGIVAAEALLAILSDAPIPAPATDDSAGEASGSTAAYGSQHSSKSSTGLLFPFVAGVLSFDTPYLGIAPSVIAYGAESHYQSASSAYSAFTSATSFFKPKSSTPSTPTSPVPISPPPAALPPATATAAEADAAAQPAWQRWGKVAMFAGAAGAVAAGGAAAYLKRDKLTEGWGWIGSHLEFVGVLARPEDLRKRVERMIDLSRDRDIGFKDVVTLLGKNANHASLKEKQPAQFGPGGSIQVGGAGSGAGATGAPDRRTFCTLPVKEDTSAFFETSVNDAARDETEAHMSMFERQKNSHYYALLERSKHILVDWIEGDGQGMRGQWYASSEPAHVPSSTQEADAAGAGGEDEVKTGFGTENEEAGLGLMDVDLNDDDGGKGNDAGHRGLGGDVNGKMDGMAGQGKEWATGEEPVWVNK